MIITATPEALTRQAPKTAVEYYSNIIDKLDELYGTGYAANHQAEVRMLTRIAADDFNAAMNIMLQEQLGGE